jgi:hypothetical protein
MRAEETQRAAQQALADAQAAKAQARADLDRAAAEKQAAQTEREAQAKLPPQRAFDVYRADGHLKDVLTRWARNEGLDLEWTAPDDAANNPEVAADGPIAAKTIKEAMHKLLEAFQDGGVQLQATFYSNGFVEIAKKGAQ